MKARKNLQRLGVLRLDFGSLFFQDPEKKNRKTPTKHTHGPAKIQLFLRTFYTNVTPSKDLATQKYLTVAPTGVRKMGGGQHAPPTQTREKAKSFQKITKKVKNFTRRLAIYIQKNPSASRSRRNQNRPPGATFLLKNNEFGFRRCECGQEYCPAGPIFFFRVGIFLWENAKLGRGPRSMHERHAEKITHTTPKNKEHDPGKFARQQRAAALRAMRHSKIPKTQGDPRSQAMQIFVAIRRKPPSPAIPGVACRIYSSV